MKGTDEYAYCIGTINIKMQGKEPSKILILLIYMTSKEYIKLVITHVNVTCAKEGLNVTFVLSL